MLDYLPSLFLPQIVSSLQVLNKKMSLWNYYRSRFHLLRAAYNELNSYYPPYQRDDYGEGGCCDDEVDDGHIILIGLLILIAALATYLLLTATVASGRRKRELGFSKMDSHQSSGTEGKGLSWSSKVYRHWQVFFFFD